MGKRARISHDALRGAVQPPLDLEVENLKLELEELIARKQIFVEY